MKWIRVLCLLGWISAGLQAADVARPAARRFLLVVEASSSSAKCAPAVENAARQLVGGAFSGMMHPGDTLGVWVYQVAVDVSFPMQVWKPLAGGTIAQGVVEHIRKHKFDEPPIWENVMPLLQRVAAMSDDLTIAVISSPGNRLNIDGALNPKIASVYAASETDLLRNKIPFVTFFAVRGGRLVDAAVNSGISPWTIPDPPVPEKPKLEAPPATSVPEKPAAPRTPRPDLLPPISTSSNAAQVLAAVVASPIPKEEPVAPVVAPRTESVPPHEPEPTPAAVKVVETPPVAKPVATVPTADPAPAVPLVAASPKPESPVTAVRPAPVVPIEPAPVAGPSSAASPSEKAPSVQAPIMARPASSDIAPPSPSPSPAPAAVVATIEPSRTGYLVGGASLLLLAFGLVGWFVMRSRRTSVPSSLITRSLDRR